MSLRTTFAHVKNALYLFTRECAGMSEGAVYWTKQKMPRPPGTPSDCMSLRIMSFMKVGMRDERRPWPADVAQDDDPIVGQREGVLSVNVYGNDAMTQMEKMRSRMDHTQFRDLISHIAIDLITVSKLVVLGESYTLNFDGMAFSVVQGVGMTKEGVRDAFITAFNLATWMCCTAVADPENVDRFYLRGKFCIDYDLVVPDSLSSNLTVARTQQPLHIAIIGDLGAIDDLSFLETRHEDRVHLDVLFRTALETVDVVGAIETVEIVNDMTGVTIVIPKPEEA